MARSRSPAPATPSAAAETLAKLAHDVGNYLSRVARNLDQAQLAANRSAPRDAAG